MEKGRVIRARERKISRGTRDHGMPKGFKARFRGNKELSCNSGMSNRYAALPRRKLVLRCQAD